MNSTKSRRRRCHLIAECIRFHSKIDRRFPLGQDDAGSITALLASERELRRINAAMRKALRNMAGNAGVCGGIMAVKATRTLNTLKEKGIKL